jgi:hypothetical protein
VVHADAVLGADGRGLLVPALARARASQLILAPEAARLVLGSDEVGLAWDAFGTDATLTGTGWDLGPYGKGRDGSNGLAVTTHGELAEQVAPLRARTSTFLRRMSSRSDTERAVPLLPNKEGPYRDRLEATLRALCTVLRDEEPLRAALAVPTRSARLAHDLADRPRERVAEHMGIGPGSIEVGVALTSTDHRWRYNRPLPGEHRPAIDEVVAAVRSHLATTAGAGTIAIADDELDRLCRVGYVDVEPWPFDALVD